MKEYKNEDDALFCCKDWKVKVGAVTMKQLTEYETKKQLEDLGYIIETQPKYRITTDEDDEFLIQTDDLEEFYESVKEIGDKKS